ncbi:MAG: Arc family DNA-binding protein [Pseudomonadota bacterium]|nr:Arc family DNA-binding protein [Pseudomonadota bacterium]
MAVNLSIKGVPDHLAERLRARAERNHRSLQGELMAIVSEAAREVGPASPPAQHGGAEAGTRVGWRSTEDIVAELKRRFPKPIEGVPLGVDIIRADRDSR